MKPRRGESHGENSKWPAVVGAVTDASGAVLVGATVRLAGPGLPGGSIVETTDDRGEYRFGGLLPGEYTINVSASGFRTIIRRGIRLPVETTFTVDVSLEVSPLAETIEIVAPSPFVDVRTSANPTTLPNETLQNLPTTRTLADLLNLAPGIGQDVAHGGTRQSNGVMIDGVSLNGPFLGEVPIELNYDWLDHVQVVGLGANAEYGGTTGAIVNGVLHSGTNQFSGLVEYLWSRPGWLSNNLGGLEAVPWLRKPRRIVTWYDTSAQVGGPVVRDRFWFFSGFQYLHHDYRPLGLLDGSTDERKPRYLVKLDAAPSARVRLQGFYMRETADIDGYGAGVPGWGPLIETSQVAEIRNDAWNARLTWSPSPATLIDARAGGFRGASRYEPRPPATRAGLPYACDYGLNHCTGAADFSEIYRRSAVASASATQRLHGFGRFHEIKIGLEHERAPNDSLSGLSGGRSYSVTGGVIQRATVWDGSRTRIANRRTTLFAQDRWDATERLTVELGVRADLNRGSVPDLVEVFSSSPVAPRLGVAWDVTADHRTVVRAHYGRYHDMLFGSLYEYKDVSRFSPRIFMQAIDGQLVEVFRESPPLDVTLAQDIGQPHVDQWALGAEREVARHAAVEVQYIRRNFGSFIGWVDRHLEGYPLREVRDPGPDGVLGTADDGGLFQVAPVPLFDQRTWLLGNPEGAWRHYDALQVVMRKREAQNWQMQASYTWSRSTGTIDNTPSTNTAGGTLSPLGGVGGNLNVRRQGPGRPAFTFNEAKLLASWRAPWLGGFVASGVGRWQTGVRWQRYFIAVPEALFYPLVNAEPVGSRTGPAFATLDLRVEKTFALRSGVRVGAMMDALNVTNEATPLSIRGDSGPFLGLPFEVIMPRQLRAGIRLAF